MQYVLAFSVLILKRFRNLTLLGQLSPLQQGKMASAVEDAERQNWCCTQVANLQLKYLSNSYGTSTVVNCVSLHRAKQFRLAVISSM